MEVGSVYTAFRQSLLKYIRSKVQSTEDAKDILQNVFAKISLNVNTLDEKQNLQNWLFTVTRNAIIDYYRVKASRQNRMVNENAAEHLVVEEEPIDTTQGLDKCLNAMIELLPDDYRLIVKDSELKGIKQKDLAKKYNMPYSSLRSRVQRGRERLKELFYDCCYIETDKHGNILESRPKSGCVDPCNSCPEE